MTEFKAVIFDLDDTIVDRNAAVVNLFHIIFKDYYTKVDPAKSDEMLDKFKCYDKENYGDGNKVKVLKLFFNEFPPEFKMCEDKMIDFWNENCNYNQWSFRKTKSEDIS